MENEAGNKSQEYTMLVNKDTNMPVVFHFIGYDDLFGSHYDEYVLEYDLVDTKIDPSVFDIYKSKLFFVNVCVCACAFVHARMYKQSK